MDALGFVYQGIGRRGLHKADHAARPRSRRGWTGAERPVMDSTIMNNC
jgi:hypothetical protein